MEAWAHGQAVWNLPQRRRPLAARLRHSHPGLDAPPPVTSCGARRRLLPRGSAMPPSAGHAPRCAGLGRSTAYGTGPCACAGPLLERAVKGAGLGEAHAFGDVGQGPVGVQQQWSMAASRRVSSLICWKPRPSSRRRRRRVWGATARLVLTSSSDGISPPRLLRSRRRMRSVRLLVSRYLTIRLAGARRGTRAGSAGTAPPAGPASAPRSSGPRGAGRHAPAPGRPARCRCCRGRRCSPPQAAGMRRATSQEAVLKVISMKALTP
jgi:hypothetical protein